MTNVLFVIDSLTCGGAQKSLISLLNNIDYSQYQVELLLFRRGGGFERFLPSQVKVLNVPQYFRFVSGDTSINFKSRVKYHLYRLKTSLKLRLNNITRKKKHSEQIVYTSIKTILNNVGKKYDVAIAYSQGLPTYFIVDKVEADRKIAWINCDYINTLYDKDLDNVFYRSIDTMVTVSSYTYDSISKMKYNYKDKLKVILDIVNPEIITKMSLEEEPREFHQNVLKILTVGRLATVKGYDLAIKAASLLKKGGYKAKWYVIGEGSERKEMERLIDKYELSNNFILLGEKSNPYPYINNCDIYVQTSRKEGFGLTVIEAKILKKPIVCTNFDTAYELINDKVDGYIVSKEENEIFSAIKKFIDNENERKRVICNLNNCKAYSSVNELEKFYEIIN
ncbi:glycosyltransferase [Clostridium grantii]|uniref:Glycosyltransferase involved in cell wall bisynthesis n=1 Tax=Clostridium grantii DSM 8605 TaxID=1121316 RepID=A0A1M5UZJ4_9CLOT|nr:glycosyltransferase [Clostridium grantii]SHH68340.1 Glycosyltransferase involved in cell wall bisynthesis [Clostridium grantii DSM 8605]